MSFPIFAIYLVEHFKCDWSKVSTRIWVYNFEEENTWLVAGKATLDTLRVCAKLRASVSTSNVTFVWIYAAHTLPHTQFHVMVKEFCLHITRVHTHTRRLTQSEAPLDSSTHEARIYPMRWSGKVFARVCVNVCHCIYHMRCDCRRLLFARFLTDNFNVAIYSRRMRYHRNIIDSLEIPYQKCVFNFLQKCLRIHSGAGRWSDETNEK